jgi:hypothetical protein
METKWTARDWLQSAIDARSIATFLTERGAKRAWERLADECEETAQIVGAMLGGGLTLGCRPDQGQECQRPRRSDRRM